MSKQLRLVDPPEPTGAGRPSARRQAPTRPVRGRPTRGRTVRTARGRRAHWASDWRLDAATRQAGRQGVAAAREALARAHRPEPDESLSQAS